MADSNAPIKSFTAEYAFLSNFYQHAGYLSNEHFYQASKTFDKEWKQKIMAATTPGKAKRLGSKCPMYPAFPSERVDIMLKLVRTKFKNPYLAKKLCETSTRPLIEGNHWHENFWGECSCDDCKDKNKLNMLGFVLMTIRAEILHGG